VTPVTEPAPAQPADGAAAALPATDSASTGLALRVEAAAEGYRVSGALQGVSLARVLDALSHEAGFELHLSPRMPEHRVTVALDNAPLPEALSRLLASTEYAIGLDRRGGISSVHLFALGEAAAPGGAALRSPLDTPAVRALPASIRSALERSVRKPTQQELAELQRLREELTAAFLQRFGPQGATSGGDDQSNSIDEGRE
jgi:hypothetical protein